MEFIRTHHDHREAGGLVWGVEPICAVLSEHGLPIAPSTYYDHLGRTPSRRAGPRRAARSRDRSGARRELRRLRRPEGVAAAEPRRHRGGPLHGGAADAPARPGRGGPRQGQTHHDRRPGRAAARDLVHRDFAPPAPDRLWVADLTYVSTWSGWVYVAFVVDAYARRILGWRTGTTMATQLVLDALEQAIWTRAREGRTDLTGLVQHHDRGSQYVSLGLQRTARRGRHPALGRLRRLLVRQRAGRDDQRALQDRADQATRAVAQPSTTSRSPPPNGSTGSTTAASTSTAATSRPPRWKPLTTLRPEPSRPLRSQTAKSPDMPVRFTLVRSPPSLSVHPCVNRRRFVADERQRTFPTETRTETTLMIKVPIVTHQRCRETESRGRRPDRTLPRFRASAQVIGLWLRLACTCAGFPSLTGQDCGRVLRDFSLLWPNSGGIKPPHQELTVPDAPNPGRSHRT